MRQVPRLLLKPMLAYPRAIPALQEEAAERIAGLMLAKR